MCTRTSVSSKDVSIRHWFICLTWLYKVTPSPNSFLKNTFYLTKVVEITVPVQTARLSWDSWADRFMPTIHPFYVAKDLHFMQVTNRQDTRSDVAFQTSRQREDFAWAALVVCYVTFIHASREAEIWSWSFFLRNHCGFGDIPLCFYYLLLCNSDMFPYWYFSITLFLPMKDLEYELGVRAGTLQEHLGITPVQERAWLCDQLRGCLLLKGEFPSLENGAVHTTRI